MSEQTPGIEAAIAVALCEHKSKTRIVGPGVRIPHRAESESMPCASCVAASQALAPVLAAAVREARAAELREAAEECEPHHGFGARWLRDRADRIAVDAPEGGEGR